MEPTPGHTIVNSEKMYGALLITFADGRCALYSAALLYEIFNDAQEMCFPEEDD
jgi:hypothetical protein